MPQLPLASLERIRERARGAAQATSHLVTGNKISLVDVRIQFIGANGLPKMDVVGSADPYFIATIDNMIKYISTVQTNTLSPVWNEQWHIKNVPDKGTLSVTVLDKDDGTPTDDYIGKFETTVEPGTKELEILGRFKRQKGVFWLKIETRPCESPSMIPYTFDGPIRYSRHSSPTVGLLTNLPDSRLYNTWKVYVKGVNHFFGNTHQHWNRDYLAAQKIFQGPTSVAVRSGIQAGHALLYARTTRNAFGTIEGQTDTYSFFTGGKIAPHRVKPAVYTYVIASDDDSFRFSETGASFFVDFASKHALHSNCNETVRYSGEFHPRPEGGWDTFDESKDDAKTPWELAIDNNSGTYAPDKTLLPTLQQLMEYNFPGFKIIAYDFHDEELTKSREACRAYALKYRGVSQTELQPATVGGEETLSHMAAACGHQPIQSLPDEPVPAE